jgi:hypothetical protein
MVGSMNYGAPLYSAWEKESICEVIQELWFCVIHTGELNNSTFNIIKVIKKTIAKKWKKI